MNSFCKKILIFIVGVFLIFLISTIYYFQILMDSSWEKYTIPLEYSMKMNSSEERIPRIIHRTWKDEKIPQKWFESYDSCKRLENRKFKTEIWTDERSRKFLEDKFPWFLSNYDSYPYPIQRVDAIRYFILYTYGGIYLDLDVGCHNEKYLEALLEFDLILPKTHPIGFSNDVMMSAPGHPFWNHLFPGLVHWNKNFGIRYLTVMASTGPLFLTFEFNTFMNKTKHVGILPLELYASTVKSFFFHLPGGSWHGPDSYVILWIYENQIVTFIFGIAVIFFLCCRKRFMNMNKFAKSDNSNKKLHY